MYQSLNRILKIVLKFFRLIRNRRYPENNYVDPILAEGILRIPLTSTHSSLQHVTSTQGHFFSAPQICHFHTSIQEKSVTSTKELFYRNHFSKLYVEVTDLYETEGFVWN